MKKRILLAVGLACLIAAFALVLVLDQPTRGEQSVTFASSYGGEPVTLSGSYWQAEGAEYAVLICPGYSCDRQKWRPFADLFAANGFSVMSFDYSGQGASAGKIGFDNAKTDSIPVQIDDAIGKLMALTGLDAEHIVLVGHSMGGRAILRLMYDYHNPAAVTTVSPRAIRNIILMSPEVNYHFNAQASLFAGTSDDAEEPWHSYSAADVAGVNVYLYGSTADDIVSNEDVHAIFARLGGIEVPGSGMWHAAQVNALGSRLTIGVTDGVLHSYQMYSPRFAVFVNDALAEISGCPATYPAGRMSLVYASWALALAGLWLTLAALNSRGAAAADETPVLTDAGKFLRRKLLMWLPGTLAAFLVCCVCVCMPFGSPVMNIPYLCFIAGYGLVMLLAYRKGRFGGTVGRLPRLALRISGGRQTAVCAAVSVGLCFVVWFVLRGTMYRLIPLNWRLFWVALAAVLMAVGYYVSGVERDMLAKAKAPRGVRIAYSFITYVPLFLLVAFYAVLKSWSGMIGQMQNMLMMYIFCVPLGDYIRRSTGSRAWGAIVTAFLFQTLMITSAALISLF